MIRRILMLITTIILILSMTACQVNDVERYQQAVNKMEEIKKGKLQFNLTIESNIKTKDLTKEELEFAKLAEDIELDMFIVFDDEQKKVMATNYFNFGGVGIDTEYYQNADKQYIKLPMIGKYMDVGDIIQDQQNKVENKENDYDKYEAIFKPLEEDWIKLISTDDVVKGENVLVDTDEGKVKATKYTINLEGEGLKQYINKMTEIIVDNLDLFMGDQSQYYGAEDINISNINKEKINQTIKEFINNLQVEYITSEMFIDIDGYITKQSFEILIHTNDDDIAIESMLIKLEDKKWSINKDQTFEFPEFNEDNLIKIEEMDQELNKMFQ